MTPTRDSLPADILRLLTEGTVIPAHPLALDAERQLDVRRQRALTRYYLDAGVGGLAVAVHTTQFAIREHGLFESVLSLAAETRSAWTDRPVVMVAGLCGVTDQARREARTALGLGYHAGLLSLAALSHADEDALIEHCEAVSREIPLIGFYLQSAVGGRTLGRRFWRRFAAIDNVVAIKVAPFDRYRSLQVVQGLVDAGAEERVTLYTGNDDHIVEDLTLPFTAMREGQPVTVRMRGGLLGHWSVWTHSAVKLHRRVQEELSADGVASPALLALASRVTDCNSAFFDVANRFKGCIAGCHEVLRRQGLLEGIWCLDPDETMGPGQCGEIDRVYREHGDLADDDFVRTHRERWLS